ncbi:MAG: hypothetical protein JKX67_01515 [Colwellia sp.]|nr:hypothetical protein [Colwellia sp.]
MPLRLPVLFWPRKHLQTLQQLANDKQLILLGMDSEVLPESVDYCDMERLSILSVLNSRAAMIF